MRKILLMVLLGSLTLDLSHGQTAASVSADRARRHYLGVGYPAYFGTGYLTLPVTPPPAPKYYTPLEPDYIRLANSPDYPTPHDPDYATH